MKAVRLKPGRIVNPLYSRSERRQALKVGQPYETPEYLTCPVGEVVDDPDCWMHCRGDNPAMAPADKECADKVLAVMNSPARRKFLDQLRRLRQPEVRRQLSKSNEAWLAAMLDAYSSELDPVDAVAVAPTVQTEPAPIAEPVEAVAVAPAVETDDDEELAGLSEE